jgi:hypothetical protein
VCADHCGKQTGLFVSATAGLAVGVRKDKAAVQLQGAGCSGCAQRQQCRAVGCVSVPSAVAAMAMLDAAAHGQG